MPFVTINIAGPGTPLLGGGQSDVGHMWFSLTDTDGTVKSYGFSPARDYQGQPLAPGAVNVHGLDDNFYQGRSFTKTIEITQGQYDAMVAFGKDPAAFGFDMQYNGLTNSCIDFTWKAMYIGGLNFINYEGKLWPVWNDTSVSVIADASQRFFRDRNPFVEFDRAIARTVCTTFFGACAAPRSDPLTLDLDGDGIETTGINTAAPILFDISGTGIQQSVGWVGSDDGFLVRDLNSNGLIDSGAELFGDATTLSNGTKATDGFAALADLDSNHDDVVNASDAAFSQLRVWRDADQDGVTDAGELQTLGSLGIAGLNVASTSHSQTLANGNELADLGTYIKADGQVGTLGQTADVNLAVDTFTSQFSDTLPVSEAVMPLPDMQGAGQVRSLHEAATLSPALAALVAQFAAATDRATQRSLLDQIVTAWSDTSAMATNVAANDDFWEFEEWRKEA